MIRTIWVIGVMILVTIPLAVAAIVGALFRADDRLFDLLGRTWADAFLRVSSTPVRVEGVEHVRMDAPQIFAANHQSWYDVLALASVIPKRYRFVAKKELERIPLWGPAWKACGHISIDRRDRASAIQSLDAAGRYIRRDNSSIIIYPEGTRSWDGRLQPFKKGAFMLALRTGVDIVPVAVVGTRAIMPKGEWRIRPGPIIVRFGEPVSTKGYAESDRDALMEAVRRRMEALLAAGAADPAPRPT